MSNLNTLFPETNKLVRVDAKQKNSGRIAYVATFADGAQHQIRTSNRKYVSVTQCGDGQGDGNTAFLFSGNAAPALTSYQQGRFIATVQIQQPA